jgi:hypothetical protein
MRNAGWMLVVVSLLTVLFARELAHARPSSATEAVRAEVRSAERAIEIGEYALALERLEALFLATNDASLLIPIATCYRELGRASDAARALKLHARLTRGS